MIVADTDNNRVELWNPALTTPLWSVTTAAGLALNSPRDVTYAVDPTLGALVYVVDSINKRVVRLSAGTGAVIDVLTPTTVSSTGAIVPLLHRPEGIAVDPGNGDIRLADTSYNKVIELTGTGAVVASFGKAGALHGQFNNPTHLSLVRTATSARLYVADTWNDRVEVFDVTNS